MPTNLNREPWSKYYSQETLEKDYPRVTAYRLLRQAAEKDPDNIALRFHGFKITYGDLLKKIDHLADCFASFDVQPGDRVTFLTVAFPEIIASFYALDKMGAVASFIDPRMDKERIHSVINATDSKLVIILDKVWPKFASLVSNFKAGHIIVHRAVYSLPLFEKVFFYIKNKKIVIPYGGNVGSFRFFENQTCTKHAAEVEYDENRPAVIVQTGGTTGYPKGVMLSDKSLNSSVFNIHLGGFGNSRDEVCLDIMPIFSSYGIVCGVHAPLSLGIHLVVAPDFTPDKFPDLIAKYKPNHTIAVPAYYEKLMYHRKTRNADYSHVILWASGGDTMSLPLEEKLDNFLLSHGAPVTINQGYGMSEVSSVATVAWNYKPRQGSVGFPALYTEVRIFEPGTDRELPLGEDGEICITGDTIMLGYYDNPEETANVLRLHADGKRWVHSGDIGHMDKEGFLYISGRIKRMIVRFDGHKVFPSAIEDVLLENPLISKCVVIGVKDREHTDGRYPLAIVEPHSVHTNHSLIREELLKLSAQKIEERGRIVDVIVIDKMPLTAVGKNNVTVLTSIYGNYKYSL